MVIIQAKYNSKLYMRRSFIEAFCAITITIFLFAFDFTTAGFLLLLFVAVIISIFFSIDYKKSIDRSVQLIISEKGLYYKPYREEFISWDNISNVTRHTVYKRYISVLLKNSKLEGRGVIKKIVKQNFPTMNFVQGRWGVPVVDYRYDKVLRETFDKDHGKIIGEDFNIPDTLDCGFGTISNAINHYWSTSE